VSGAADILLALRRANVEGHANRRTLEGVGRFDETPEQLVIEWQEGTYINLGDSMTVERSAARGTLLDFLPSEPPGTSEANLIEQTGIPRSTVRRALEDLMNDGVVHASPTGAGKSGRAKGYFADCPAPRVPGHNGSNLVQDAPPSKDHQASVVHIGMDPGHNASEADVNTNHSTATAGVLSSPHPFYGQHDNDVGVL
jgi:hypothetical protein